MICTPIVAATTEAALSKMERAAPLVDLVELRIDRIPGADLERLITACRTPVIVTNRSRGEGGGFTGTEDERIERLKEAVRLGADYIDIEISTDPALKTRLQEAMVGTSAKMIASWHDFSGTPPLESLKARLEECMADGPAIAKIVTHANEPSDSLRVLELIPYARRRGQAIIAFCMGRQGKISRIVAPRLGSVIAYASMEPEEGSAPGQLTIRQMREINRLMEDEQSAEDLLEGCQ